jgi:hypothetical protein
MEVENIIGFLLYLPSRFQKLCLVIEYYTMNRVQKLSDPESTLIRHVSPARSHVI